MGPSPKSEVMRSRFFLALIAIAILDLVLKLAWTPTQQQLLENSNHSKMWWAVKDYYESPAPDVILLGSSLMQQVVCDGDATSLQRSVDPLDHHRCVHIEQRLRRATSSPVRTFSLSVPGEFASDAALVSSLFTQNKQPARIIYGIAPRDFMDNSLSSPSSTETFRLISRFFPKYATERRAYSSDIQHCVALVESFLSSVSGIYRNRIDFTYTVSNQFRNLSNFVLASQADKSADLLTLKDRRILPEELSLGLQVVKPENDTPMYFDNRAQYICSYQPFRPRIYNAQISYYKDMLRQLRDKSIGVTVVNMPITQDNMDLMIPGFYDGYLRDAKKIAEANGAEFIDLNKKGLFEKRHFKDTVHLNGYGAIKFGELLTEAIQPSTIAEIASKARSRRIAENIDSRASTQ